MDVSEAVPYDDDDTDHAAMHEEHLHKQAEEARHAGMSREEALADMEREAEAAEAAMQEEWRLEQRDRALRRAAAEERHQKNIDLAKDFAVEFPRRTLQGNGSCTNSGTHMPPGSCRMGMVYLKGLRNGDVQARALNIQPGHHSGGVAPPPAIFRVSSDKWSHLRTQYWPERNGVLGNGLCSLDVQESPFSTTL